MRQRGSILIYTILVLISITTISLALLRLFIPKFKVASESVSSVVAISVADSVMEWCLYSNRNGASTIPPLGQVAWWKFDETSGSAAADSSGSSNTGNLINGPIWTAGHINNGLQFDGINDYVRSPALGSPPTSVTLSAWIKPASQGGVVFSELGQSTINSGWHDSQIEVETSGLVKACVWTGSLTCVNVGNLIFNTWNHVAMVYDSSTSRLYGYLNNAGTNAGAVKQYPGTLYYAIGATDGTNGGNGQYFLGQIDDAHIYNRALTPAEITQLFNYTGNSPNEPSQPTFSIGTANFPITYQIYRGGAVSICPSGETPLDYRTVGNYRGISRSLEIQ